MRNCFLVAMLLCAVPETATAQVIPDLTKYKTINTKLEALADLCDTLSDREDYERERQVATYALSITPASDFNHLSLFHFYLGVVTEYQGSGAADSSFYYYEKALAIARKGKVPVRIREALARLLFKYSNAAGYASKSDAALKEILRIVDTTKSEGAKVALYATIANYYSIKGEYETEIKYLLQSIAVKKKLIETGELKDREQAVTALINLAELYLALNQPEKGISYAQEARRYIVSSKSFLSHYFKDMTDLYLSMEQPEKAKVYYDSVAGLIKPDNKLAGIRINKIALDLGFADYYLQRKKPDIAQVHMARANELAAKWADNYMMTQVKYMTGEVYFAQKDFKKALPYLKASESFCETWDRQLYVELLKTLARCYAETGQPQLAYAYYEKYIPVRDSLYLEGSKKSIADAEAQYQNKDKQQQIEIKNLQIDEARKQRIWLTSGVSFLALSLVLLGIIYRNKRKNAEILDQKNHEMSKLIEELEAANRTKAKLFSIISHDLRSPISQVYQFLKLQQLNPKLLNESQKAELSEKIQTATGSLLETMEDLLLWSKTQINQFKADIQPVEVTRITEQCLKLLQLNIEAKQIQIENEIPEKAMVETDPYYLQAIVRNLLQNAIKAADDNSLITLSLNGDEKHKILAIENTGPAFSQEAYQHILAQKDGNRGLNGLGLRLVDELSEKTGLKIQFENPSENLTRALVVF
ncbi:tetratricopeptide repeat-containing sensor histidine kinase [Dyadobacter sp. CY323]|uniref:tetratricopeptide repeat-containing sensor histidine kinase n=1 Tax=Dyadobacter sp. CY323 TaxID=2907302 RepID=UPI001F36A980|nr:tetratricopeptide repeat-containing sensor histidine kinase [Dyadobacter sp. CY323]MCE6987933.1 tetratricopeptide repeat-containing sensor histidine kinase [Dyadobacter sp. CY323]